MDEELLATLEDRWNRLAQTLERFKQERDRLQEEVAAREAALRDVTQKNEALAQNVASLEAERTLFRERIEKLLARFEELGI